MTARALWAVVPAAGQGTRMGGTLPKQYLPLLGETLLARSLRAVSACPGLSGIVLAVAPGDIGHRGAIAGLPVPVRVVEGGAERADSVRAGLDALAGELGDEDWALVHDAARPCVTAADLAKLCSAVADDPCGGLLACPATDTLKRADHRDGTAVAAGTLDRDEVWHALTPQLFRYGALRRALGDAAAAGFRVTDEASAMERAGHRPVLVEGRRSNIKITRPGDLELAAAILREQSR